MGVPNWNLDVILSFWVALGYLIAFIFFIRMYLKQRHQFLLFFSLFALGFVLWALFRGLSNLILSPPLFLINVYVTFPGYFLAVAIYDIINREKVGFWKMTIFGLLVGANVAYITDPNSVAEINQSGELFLTLSGPSLLLYAIVGVYAILWLFAALLKVNYYAPKDLKKYSRAFPIAFGMGIFALILTQIQALLIYQIIYDFALIVGLILILWAFSKAPQLGFVLPFKVRRLTVLSTTSGIPLFDYVWTHQKQLVDDTLYSGMLQGVGTIFQESLGRGKVQEVHMENGILILHYDETQNVAFVLLANTMTRTLRHALDYFAARFLQTYAVGNFSGGDVEQFSSASTLVQECFAFIPE
ncbi:MAG TPA: hypothetical protein VKK79_02890 [Candidatus Lokiarchaeia archaeon]|nr:hypothetical protein [Candidatus Lokiarchaeia archaeon]